MAPSFKKDKEMIFFVYAASCWTRTVLGLGTVVSLRSGRLFDFLQQPDSVFRVLALFVAVLIAIAGSGFALGGDTPRVVVASSAIMDLIACHVLYKLMKTVPSYFYGLTFMCSKSVADVYICVVVFEGEFLVVLAASQLLYSLSVHYILFQLFENFQGRDLTNDACEIMIKNYFAKLETCRPSDEVAGIADQSKLLSLSNLKFRNTVKVALQGGGLLLCHDRVSLQYDENIGRAVRKNGYEQEVKNHDRHEREITKIEFEKLKRYFRSTSDRSFRAVLFPYFVLPSLNSVQRIKATRGFLTKYTTLTLGFHKDSETLSLRHRISNIDDEWLFVCRAIFVICLERFVQGFPSLFSPDEDFFKQCKERLQKKSSFNCDVDIRFYLVEVPRVGKSDLQPYLLEDLCIKEQGVDEDGVLKNTLVLYVPLKATVLSEEENEILKHENEKLTVEERQHLLDQPEEDTLRKVRFKLSNIGEVSAVKAGRLAATSFMRHCIFYEEHEKILSRKSLKNQKIKKLGQDRTNRRRSSVNLASVAPASLGSHESGKQEADLVNLPYRPEEDGIKSGATLTAAAIDQAILTTFSDSLVQSPENILASLVLTGFFGDEDMRSKKYQFLDGTESFFQICERRIKDPQTMQDISFVSTIQNNTMEDDIRKRKRLWLK